MMKKTHLAFCASLPFLLGACALKAPPEKVSVAPPSQWFSPLPKAAATDNTAAGLPHHGTLTDLSQWWQQQNDPLLVELIQSAQTVSPTVATALSRIEQSRATSVSAGAALLPKLDATASVTRTNTQVPLPLGTTTQVALQPSWEADLFGGNRATSRAAQSRLQGAQAVITIRHFGRDRYAGIMPVRLCTLQARLCRPAGGAIATEQIGFP